MVTPSAGSVVLVRFPFSDLSSSKQRPAVVLADASRGDWILCQVTSKAYSDPRAVELDSNSFATGSLHLVSFARPGKLFTANQSLFVKEVGTLNDAAFKHLIESLVALLNEGVRP